MASGSIQHNLPAKPRHMHSTIKGRNGTGSWSWRHCASAASLNRPRLAQYRVQISACQAYNTSGAASRHKPKGGSVKSRETGSS